MAVPLLPLPETCASPRMPVDARSVFAPLALLGAAGRLQRMARGLAPIARDWRCATVDVVIAVDRNQATIVTCLAGLHSQSLRPRRIRLVEICSGPRDGTAVLAREFAQANGLRIEIVERHDADRRPAALVDEAAALDGDVVLMLDGNTVLDSADYLEHCMCELYRDESAAGVCGTRLPLRDSDRRRWVMSDAFRRWLGDDEYRDPLAPRGPWQRLGRWLADSHAECVGLVEQRFLQRGRLHASGVCHPCGAVAYRRDDLRMLSESCALELGGVGEDDEELVLGAALAHERMRVVQITQVVARVRYGRGIPGLSRARMRRLRNSVIAGRRLRARLRASVAPAVGAAEAPPRGVGSRAPSDGNRRRASRGYGTDWASTCAMLDRLAFPLAIVALAAAGRWAWLGYAVSVELAAWLAVLAVVAPQARVATVGRGLVAAPLRYLGMLADAVAVAGLAGGRRRGPHGNSPAAR